MTLPHWFPLTISTSRVMMSDELQQLRPSFICSFVDFRIVHFRYSSLATFDAAFGPLKDAEPKSNCVIYGQIKHRFAFFFLIIHFLGGTVETDIH
jgi:hypothetical protein